MKINKSRTAKIIVLAFTMLFSLNMFFTDYTSVKHSATAQDGYYSVAYKDVTGEVDLSDIARANFNDSVLAAPKKTSVEDKWVVVGLSGKSMIERMKEKQF